MKLFDRIFGKKESKKLSASEVEVMTKAIDDLEWIVALSHATLTEAAEHGVDSGLQDVMIDKLQRDTRRLNSMKKRVGAC